MRDLLWSSPVPCLIPVNSAFQLKFQYGSPHEGEEHGKALWAQGSEGTCACQVIVSQSLGMHTGFARHPGCDIRGDEGMFF